MSSEGTEKQSPFTRPGFIAAAAVVALIVVCAIILVIVNLSGGNPAPIASSTSTPVTSSSPSASAAANSDSVCGLAGVELSGSVTAAPAATWAYEGTTAYPTSPTYGPGKTAPEGYRYCFQHSPVGALFAAANALAQGSATGNNAAWSQYVLAAGPHRAELLAQGTTSSGTSGSRTTIQGFRLLSYDGAHATVDLAANVSTTAGASTVSGVYTLVWADGDWKISTETSHPLDVAPIPNVAGYTTWGQ